MPQKILLADSNVTVLHMGTKVLSAADHEVVAVSNGLAAIRKMADFKPDVLLVDVHLAGYSGVELCEKVKAVAETAKVLVLLTVSKMDPAPSVAEMKSKPDGFITKPFDALELVTTIERLADASRENEAKAPRLETPERVLKGAVQNIADARQRTAEERWAELRAFRARQRSEAARKVRAVPDQPGGETCDVCGHVNEENVSVCQKCDVPLPSSVKSEAVAQSRKVN